MGTTGTSEGIGLNGLGCYNDPAVPQVLMDTSTFIEYSWTYELVYATF
jgi:hypothetical protein